MWTVSSRIRDFHSSHFTSNHVRNPSSTGSPPGLRPADHSFNPWSFLHMNALLLIHFQCSSPAVQTPWPVLTLTLGYSKHVCPFSTSAIEIEFWRFIPFAGYYDFKFYPIHSGNDDILITLSALSHIEQLTIHSAFHYVVVSDSEKWGLYSPIPAITQLFSTNTPSLKHLFLNFDFSVGSFHPVQTKSLPWSLLSEIICTPLAHLLSTIYAFECPGSSSALSVQAVLRPGGAYSSHLSTAPGPKPRAIPQYIIHSLLSDSKELMQFVEKGIITPSVPASFNKNDSLYF